MQSWRGYLKYGVFFCALFWVMQVYAWGSAGHLISAQIAYQHLTPAAKARADTLIAATQKQYPNSPDFITASLWADDLKAQGDKQYNHLHYVNIAINLQGERIDRPIPSPNVITAIASAQKVLQDKNQSLQAQSIALRGLIHWVGDIHQPLHCVSRFGPAWPHGDKGGTLFLLSKRSGYSNLHAYWDSGLGSFPKIKRPKTAAQQTRLQQIAQEFEDSVTIKPQDIAITKPEQWAQEGVMIAGQSVYSHIYPKEIPSIKYATQNEIIAKQRVVLAGLRLAGMLNVLLSETE